MPNCEMQIMGSIPVSAPNNCIGISIIASCTLVNFKVIIITLYQMCSKGIICLELVAQWPCLVLPMGRNWD